MFVELVRHAPSPVLVVKRRPVRAYKRIAVASDLSETSVNALKFAQSAFPNATITLFHGLDMPLKAHVVDLEEVERGFRQIELANTREWLASVVGSRVDSIDIVNELGGVVRNLASYVADMKVDLVVVGSAGRTGLASAFAGSTAIEILERVDCDVLAVRQG